MFAPSCSSTQQQNWDRSRVKMHVRCNLKYYYLRYEYLPPSGCEYIIAELGKNTKPWQYDSKWKNWASVMGTKWWQWFLPIEPTELEVDGRKYYEFDLNERTKNFLRAEVNEKLREIRKSKVGEESQDSLSSCPTLKIRN